MTLLAMWIFYTAFGVTFFSAVFLWAVRTGQFTSQDRARFMPLADLPAADEPAEAPRPPRRAMLVPLVLLCVSALGMAAAVWVAYVR